MKLGTTTSEEFLPLFFSDDNVGVICRDQESVDALINTLAARAEDFGERWSSDFRTAEWLWENYRDRGAVGVDWYSNALAWEHAEFYIDDENREGFNYIEYTDIEWGEPLPMPSLDGLF